ncbi:2-dehydro-3-deoxyphosphooctonate aldolase [Chloroherpeton thalassium ATCC 35110]|uniref:3-deoxy-8-phosphooctulonate synthase n=1 Tax=Chloroherpeton thalassium (strain ATCC 35110 / GB-78) TaxID=517418 RepID=B3QV89_CHLT3|nr:3-deoxy-8-phosphooctulonate synthase [Chloroherpeton thalassium]ACF13043.1 2-dehydro-3-deoxyphosphooctonate aldolase [Chloroherpeton thalassium ATCC 35110]
MRTAQFEIAGIPVGTKEKLLVFAGPCVVENREMLFSTAEGLKKAAETIGFDLIFKASYKKANRSSSGSFTGIGDEAALALLAEVRQTFDLPIVTDIHHPEEAALASKFVDVLQIPAFLCRQTELLEAAGKTGLAVNIKKGQFMAPGDMRLAAEKVAATGNTKILLTERGTSFGYHNLVVDFRGLPQMSALGYPVIFDATHSVQLPSAGQGISSGERQYIQPLARAAVAVGVTGLFFEVHPTPEKALSDSATQLPLSKAEPLLRELQEIFEITKKIQPLI